MSKSELNFRAAFERLKKNNPKILPKDSKLTQNNVAREAGIDPSGLKKSRFPTLINEIQEYIIENNLNLKKPEVKSRKTFNKSLSLKIHDLTEQRDNLANYLNIANSKILELNNIIEDLKKQLPESNIISILSGKP